MQRIVIGRSFAMHPDLLLMDEPYGQMDIKMRYYLEDEVIKLWQATGSTVIFITHNVEEAVYLSNKCLILSQKPTTVKEELKIDLPRPRDIADPWYTGDFDMAYQDIAQGCRALLAHLQAEGAL